MDLSHINLIVTMAYVFNDNYKKLNVNKLYRVTNLSWRKTLWGSMLELILEQEKITVFIPSLKYQNLFEQDNSLYYSLKHEVEKSHIFIKYCGCKKFEVVYE